MGPNYGGTWKETIESLQGTHSNGLTKWHGAKGYKTGIHLYFIH
jgi:hypothetical protein